MGLAAGALFFSAGTAVLLLNVLYRIGVEGDKERDTEQSARDFFDKHGHWPDEPPSAGARPPARLEPQLLPEDLLHDLVGAAADRAEAGVAHGARDLHVSVQHAERGLGDLERGAL